MAKEYLCLLSWLFSALMVVMAFEKEDPSRILLNKSPVLQQRIPISNARFIPPSHIQQHNKVENNGVKPRVIPVQENHTPQQQSAKKDTTLNGHKPNNIPHVVDKHAHIYSKFQHSINLITLPEEVHLSNDKALGFWKFANHSHDNSDVFLCPVSSNHLTLTEKSHYLYPTDVFNGSTEASSVSKASKNKFEECWNFDDNPNRGVAYMVPHKCPTNLLFCPVLKEHVLAATTDKTTNLAETWPKVRSVCQLLNPTKPSNVYIFGNSVVAGVASQGCKKNHPKEKFADESSLIECTWSYYFANWFQSINKSKVKFFNFASPGRNTITTTQSMANNMQMVNAPPFTNNDIVLFDHSATDQVLMQAPHNVDYFKQTLQLFIEQIREHSVKDQFPVVVIIFSENFHAAPGPIAQVYHDFAQKNGLYFYNIHNSIHAFDQNKALQPPFTNVLSVNPGNNRINTHPPWFVHFFIADLLAALVTKDMSQCIDKTNSIYETNSSVPFTVASINNSSSAGDIDSSLMLCNAKYDPLLQLSIVDNQLSVTTGAYETPSNCWKVAPDGKGRVGIIRSIENGDTFNARDNATVEFRFNVGSSKAWNVHSSIGAKYMLSLTYLSSYVNVGVVDVYICNQYMTTIDALWTDKISIPAIRNVVFHSSICADKSSTAANKVLYPVQLKHRIQVNGSSVSDLSQVATIAPRFMQMFKVTSVTVCQV